MYRLCTLILLLLALFSCQPQEQQQQQEATNSTSSIYLDSLKLVLTELYERGHTNGFGVAIANSEGTLYEAGYGWADKENQIPYTENTIQNIASISKTFIGLALLKAQEMDLLKLDDPVNKYLSFAVSNPHFPEQPITIRHLATHTSSIIDTDIYDEKAYVAKDQSGAEAAISLGESFNPPSEKTSMAAFLEKVLSPSGEWYQEEGFLKVPPGQQFDYTNVGATLAALAIEGASKKSFADFTREHILELVPMNHSAWSFDRINMDKHTKLYARLDTIIPFYTLNTFADGGMLASASDMAKYLNELIKGKAGQGTLLTAESYREYYSAQIDGSHFTEERDAEFPFNDEYSMGIFMGLSGMGNIGHSGGDPGTSTLMFFNPEKDLGCYLAINTSIINQEGVNQFFETMLALFEYGEKINKEQDTL